jgi:hypothetical protein
MSNAAAGQVWYYVTSASIDRRGLIALETRSQVEYARE